jgi:hypothetical protein
MAALNNYNVPTGDESKRDDDVARNDHIERAETTATNDDAVFSKFPKMEKVDEFGAHAKTDPREIALVKKLDRYILVSVPAAVLHVRRLIKASRCYGLCTSSIISTGTRSSMLVLIIWKKIWVW